MAWGLGMIIGPAMGGFLSEPCESAALGALCAPGAPLRVYPYLLPCLVASILACIAAACGAFLLRESRLGASAALTDGADSLDRGSGRPDALTQSPADAPASFGWFSWLRTLPWVPRWLLRHQAAVDSGASTRERVGLLAGHEAGGSLGGSPRSPESGGGLEMTVRLESVFKSHCDAPVVLHVGAADDPSAAHVCLHSSEHTAAPAAPPGIASVAGSRMASVPGASRELSQHLLAFDPGDLALLDGSSSPASSTSVSDLEREPLASGNSSSENASLGQGQVAHGKSPQQPPVSAVPQEFSRCIDDQPWYHDTYAALSCPVSSVSTCQQSCFKCACIAFVWSTGMLDNLGFRQRTSICQVTHECD